MSVKQFDCRPKMGCGLKGKFLRSRVCYDLDSVLELPIRSLARANQAIQYTNLVKVWVAVISHPSIANLTSYSITHLQAIANEIARLSSNNVSKL